MEMCRACLATTKDVVQMDAALLNNFNLLTDLNIKSEEMSLYSCKTCSDAIQFCIQFREKCIASDTKLKDILDLQNTTRTDNKVDNTVTVIKQEVKLELDLDSDSFLYEYLDFESMNRSDTEIKQEDDEVWTPKEIHKNLRKKRNKKPSMKTEPQKKKIKCKSKCNNNYDARLINCGICSKKFKDTDDLLKHLEYHKNDQSCGICPERFIDFTHLLAHRMVHVPDKQKRCHLCSRRFIASHYLECHFVKQHKLRGEGGQLLCKQCLAPFDSASNLTKHCWAVHSDFKYYCNECDKRFRIKSALITHLRSHNEKKGYQCNMCNFSCKQLSGVREHNIRKHIKTRALCKTCGRLFPSQQLLDKHVCKHFGGILCPKCGISKKTTSAMASHMRSHSNERPYKCDRCPKQFKNKSTYNIHLNRHDNIRPYSCEYCSMSFYAPTVLLKHRRVHTGEKPYVCKICSKGFTGNHNLKVHMKVHGLDLVVKKNVEPLD